MYCWCLKNIGLLLSTICFPIFIIGGLTINPYNEDGSYKYFGTHTQLFLPPCIGNYITGLRCPGCGLTTSISLLVHGDFLISLKVHAGGVLLFGLAFICFIRAFIFFFLGLKYTNKELGLFNQLFICIFICINIIFFIRLLFDTYLLLQKFCTSKSY